MTRVRKRPRRVIHAVEGRRVKSALGLTPEEVRRGVRRINKDAGREIAAGIDGQTQHWKFTAALLAVNIATLTIGRGARTAARLQRRGLEVLIEAVEDMKRVELDRGVALYLGGMLLGLMPGYLGRGDVRSTLAAALAEKPSQKDILELARTIRATDPGKRRSKLAVNAALVQLEISNDERFDKIVRRLSDFPLKRRALRK